MMALFDDQLENEPTPLKTEQICAYNMCVFMYVCAYIPNANNI